MNGKYRYVCLSWMIAVLLCTVLTSHADVIVGAGETLAITNSEDIGVATLQMGAGSTLVFEGADLAAAGLNEYTRTGISTIGTPFQSSYGTWLQVTTNIYRAGTNITVSQTEYIYTGRWYIPEAGVYSFYEFIDDYAAVAVDGQVVFRDTNYSTESCVQDVSLLAGWHDLEVRVYNGAAAGGTKLPGLNAIRYSPSNDLISATNLDNSFPFVDPGDASILKNVHNGCLIQKTLVDGDVTFDLSAQGLAAPLVVAGGLLPQPGAAYARVTVTGGVGEVIFNGSTDSAINFPPFNADVAFSGFADPKGVTFQNQCTVFDWPTSCVWRVADDAVIALAGTNNLGTGDVVLTNHSIYVLSPTAVADEATIRVQGTNLTASIKPCTLDPYGVWYGVSTTRTNDVSLEGANSTLAFPLSPNLYLQGGISGTGTVVKTGGGRLEILEICDFVGTVACNAGVLVFDSVSAGHSNNTVTLGAGSIFALYAAGHGSTETETWIKRLEGSNTSGYVVVPKYQTMVVDYLDGSINVRGVTEDTSVLHINTLGTNAILGVVEKVTVEIDHIEPGASILLVGGTTSLKVTGTGNVLDKLIIESGEASVSGDFKITTLQGGGTLVKKGDTTLDISYNTFTGDVHVMEGTLRSNVELISTNSVLGSLPSLWLDASAEAVFTQYESYTFTNGFKIIEQWDDARPYATGYAKQTRGEAQWQTYPYAMPNVLNGMSVLSMGSYQTMLSSVYESRKEARRMPLDHVRTPEYVVMVIGSQNGGGAAVLGSEENVANSFTRGGSTTDDYRNPATPILKAGDFDVWLDGVSVDATATGLNGGYQILSIKTDKNAIGTLGWDAGYQKAGGQNYAEILLYTNVLTSVQRVSIEAYLAQKWNLPYGPLNYSSVNVDAGATLEVGGYGTVSNVTGAGHVKLSGAAVASFGGLFYGTVEMDGGACSIADLKDVPGDEAVPQTDMCLWIDPCMTNRAVFGGAYTPTRPLAVAALYDRTTDDRYLLGTSFADTGYDRRPWLSEATGPLGNAQHWINYTNIYSGDNNGNTLRLNTDPSRIGTGSGFAVPTDVRSGFIVLDSSRGGGVPLTYDVHATQVVTRNDYTSFSSPIWGSGTTASLKSGATYLDGEAVDGAAHGYSGRNELLSFVATNIFQVAYFGYYGGDFENGNKNRERLGEIILFDSEINSETRMGIEAYLMKKWLGKARDGYCDMTMAAVSGSGTVNAVRPSQLPSFDSGFTGAVNLSGTAYNYTVSKNEAGEYVVAPNFVIPGTLSVPATGTITVDFAATPSGGTYPLMIFGSISGDGFDSWSLATTGESSEGIVRLLETDTGLSLQIIPQGTIILIR